MTPLKTFQNLSGEKRKAIFEQSLYEFAEKGYHGASINSIVQTLGIAKGSIYQYFGDKKGLFLYIFSNSMELVKENLRSVRDSSGNEILSVRLNRTMNAGINFINDHPVVYRLYVKILSESDIPLRDEILSSIKQYSYNYIESLLIDAKKNGELKKNIDIAKAGFIIDAVMDKFLLARAMNNTDCCSGIFEADNNEIENWISTLVTMLCNGISI